MNGQGPYLVKRNETSGPLISVNMLFTDLTRWEAFASARLTELVSSQLPIELLIALNGEVPREVVESTVNGTPIPTTVFETGENNIPRARNLLARESRGRFLLISDDDCEISPGGIAFMLHVIEQSPLGVIGLRSRSEAGKGFKPRDWEPQIRHPKFGDLSITAGVHGMAFLTYRDLSVNWPLSEVRTLRGEWVDWFTRLWRSGVVSAYALDDPRYYIIDHFIPEGSATRYHTRLQYVLISLLSLVYEYSLTSDRYGSAVLYEHYLLPNLPEEDRPYAEEIWSECLRLAAASFQTTLCLPSVSHFCGQCFRRAFDHCVCRLQELEHFRTEVIEPNTDYGVGPFEMFAPENQGMLADALSRAKVPCLVHAH